MKYSFLTLLSIAVVTFCLSFILSGCIGGEPTFVESGPPISKIIVETDPYDNCDSAASVNRVLGTTYSRSQETAWYVEGKAGIGGKIPLGFLIPSLDIESAVTTHYGSKETRTWERTFSQEYIIPANTKTILAVYYQEITRKGTIEIYGKRIEYQFPAELSQLGQRKFDVSCEPQFTFYEVCMSSSGGTVPVDLSPSYHGIDRTWFLEEPLDGEIVLLDIETQDNYLIIHLQTDGSSGVADWGTQYKCIWSDPLEVTYEHLGYKRTDLTFQPITSGNLWVTAVDTYINPPVVIPPQKTEYIFR